MKDYLHGTLSQIQAVGTRVAGESQSAIVYIGTAPVHTVENGAQNVNVPILVNNIAEARKYFGYSEDWAKYTLCEAMYVHLVNKGVGPLVFINVLDPAKHRADAEGNVSMTPENGRMTIAAAESVILDSVKVLADEEKSLTPVSGSVSIENAQNIMLESITVKSGATEKAKGTDYSATYDETTKAITITELSDGALGTSALTITCKTAKEKGIDYTIAYNTDKKTITIAEATPGALGNVALGVTYNCVDATKVTTDDVIGESDGLGLNTGVFAMKNVYQLTGCIPSYMAAPGFSSIPAVHSAMHTNSVKVNNHWDVYMFVDLPIVDGDTPVTLETARTFKNNNGYNHENETVYFPMAEGIDGRKYHISVLSAANFQELLSAQDGIPYKTASNTECGIVQNLYTGENNRGRVYDDSLINEKLNKHGIASAAYVGGRWAIWGCHSADYNQENGDQINVAETNRMMLYYISNDFQHRRNPDVDKPMTNNDLRTIIAEEQTRIDALLNMHALTYGEVSLNATAQARSDIMNGDYGFMFNVTTTPLAKSLKAIVNWTDDGFVTYFENVAAD